MSLDKSLSIFFTSFHLCLPTYKRVHEKINTFESKYALFFLPNCCDRKGLAATAQGAFQRINECKNERCLL